MATISPGEPLHIIDYVKDYLMNFYFVQEQGMVLFGPDSKSLIPRISKEDFLEEVVHQTKQWRGYVKNTRSSRSYQAYAILTLCRALYTFKNGKQASKKQAAQWAQKELPEWTSLIQRALKWREQYRDKNVDNKATYPETEKFVNYVIDRILTE